MRLPGSLQHFAYHFPRRHARLSIVFPSGRAPGRNGANPLQFGTASRVARCTGRSATRVFSPPLRRKPGTIRPSQGFRDTPTAFRPASAIEWNTEIELLPAPRPTPYRSGLMTGSFRIPDTGRATGSTELFRTRRARECARRESPDYCPLPRARHARLKRRIVDAGSAGGCAWPREQRWVQNRWMKRVCGP